MKIKKILSLLFFIIITIAISGCESNPEDVKLKSSKDIKKYVNKYYGSAKLINTKNGDVIKLADFRKKMEPPRTMMEPLVKMGYSIMTPDGINNL